MFLFGIADFSIMVVRAIQCAASRSGLIISSSGAAELLRVLDAGSRCDVVGTRHSQQRGVRAKRSRPPSRPSTSPSNLHGGVLKARVTAV